MSELTFGERAVGISFNPSRNAEVDLIKSAYAGIIDLLDQKRTENPHDKELVRLCSIGITEAQGAQMWAVKAMTCGL
jgi:hypothetical protein